MAKLRCLCGQSLSNGTMPSGVVYHLASDALEPEDGESADDFESRMIETSRSVWRCDACERMAVFEPGSNDAQWYEKRNESPQPPPASPEQ